MTDVWVPSLALALLHFSALSYAATFITYLLNVGFSLFLITVARACGSVIEVSSTFIAPAGIRVLGRTKALDHDEEGIQELLPSNDEMSPTLLIYCSFWLLALWYLRHTSDSKPQALGLPSFYLTLVPTTRAFTTFTMFFFLSFSRPGLWVFDLTTQEITQTGVPTAQRSSFAGIEMAFVSLFELTQWIVAAILNKPEQFRWIALGSFAAVGCSSVTYSVWVRQQRGHMVH